MDTETAGRKFTVLNVCCTRKQKSQVDIQASTSRADGKNSKNKFKSSRMEENVTRRTKIISFKQKNKAGKIQ